MEASNYVTVREGAVRNLLGPAGRCLLARFPNACSLSLRHRRVRGDSVQQLSDSVTQPLLRAVHYQMHLHHTDGGEVEHLQGLSPREAKGLQMVGGVGDGVRGGGMS